MGTPAITPNPYADFQKPATGANPYAEFQAPAATPPPNPQPMPQMSAQPPSTHPIGDWLHNLDTDMTEGGNRTLPGRILGHMQGRGAEGYTGLNSGGNAGTAQFMGSPVLGPIHAAQGVAETPDHPIMGPIHAAEGVLQTVAIPGAMMGGEGAEAAINAIPSRAHAAGIFTDIENAAKDVPVSMQNTRGALDEFGNSVKTGGVNRPVMTKLARRIGTPTPFAQPEPINFPEARDFYTNISRATAKPGLLRRAIENPSMPSFRMNAGNVREALNSDISDAAGTIGRGEDYINAMNEYRRAAQLNKGIKTVAKVGGGLALAGSGLGDHVVTKFIKGVTP